MTTGPANPAPRARRPASRALAFVAVGAIAVGLVGWGGCSVEKHYELLSFFFDGVPDPSAPATATDRFGRRRTPGVVYNQHQPYAENACDACHRGSRQLMLTRVQPSVCLECHEDATGAYPVMHGPVASSACMECHDAHESPYDHLLKSDGVDLCLPCHGATLYDEPSIPEHEDRERRCLDCHVGHGGTDRSMLRDRGAWSEVAEPLEVSEDDGS